MEELKLYAKNTKTSLVVTIVVCMLILITGIGLLILVPNKLILEDLMLWVKSINFGTIVCMLICFSQLSRLKKLKTTPAMSLNQSEICLFNGVGQPQKILINTIECMELTKRFLIITKKCEEKQIRFPFALLSKSDKEQALDWLMNLRTKIDS